MLLVQGMLVQEGGAPCTQVRGWRSRLFIGGASVAVGISAAVVRVD